MTLPAQDIVERLRERVDRWKLNGDSARVSVPLGELRGVLAEIETYRTAFDGIGPSSRITALEAEVGRLQEALKPFATYLDTAKYDLDNKGLPLPDDLGMGWVYLTVGNFRRARAALANEEAGQ